MTSLQFHSAQFDHQSELPAEDNAGNRFYGRDVAQFIVAGLRAAGYDANSLDEDWGWLVSSRGDDGVILEVAIYNLSEHREGGRAGVPDWGLWLRTYRKKKLLGLLPSMAETAVSAAQVARLRDIFAAADISLTAWADGPHAEGAA